jgi:hypothetical protein
LDFWFEKKPSGNPVHKPGMKFCTRIFGDNFLHRTYPGVDVMITIFCDFYQFSAKKFAFFSKTNVMIKILNNLALFWVKNANFVAIFFGENIFKIVTSVPGL